MPLTASGARENRWRASVNRAFVAHAICPAAKSSREFFRSYQGIYLLEQRILVATAGNVGKHRLLARYALVGVDAILADRVFACDEEGHLVPSKGRTPNLKNLGNWRGQLECEDVAGPKARRGRRGSGLGRDQVPDRFGEGRRVRSDHRADPAPDL